MCQADITVQDTRKFDMKKLDDNGHVIPGDNIKLTVTGIYKEKNGVKKYSFFFDSSEPVDMGFPLNLVVLGDSLTTKYNIKNSSSVNFSEYSINQVFLWLYSLNQKNEDGPTIGRLYVGNITRPETSGKNDSTRIRKLEQFNTQAKINKQRLNFERVTLANFIEELKNIKLKIGTDNSNLNQDFALLGKTIDEYKESGEMGTSAMNTMISTVQKIAMFADTLNVRQKNIQTQQVYLDSLIKDTSNINKSIKNADSLLTKARGIDIDSLKKDTTTYQDEIKTLKAKLESGKKEIISSNGKIATLEKDNSKWPKNLINDTTLLADFTKLLRNTSNTLTGYKITYDSVQVLLKKKMLDSGFFEIEKISVQFERGYLERVQVWVGNIVGGVDIYENIYAFGFTSITNLSAFQSIPLFERNRESRKFIYLSDALPRYDNLLDLYTRDYSPADTVINEYKPDSGPITLRKEQNVNLFESKIFTDLEGLNENKPNGLIQIEVAKRFNLITYRKQIGHFRADFTSLSYLYLYGGLTKIEDKQKDFALRNNNTIVNGAIVSPSYISNLDLRRYENLHIGVDVNTFLYDYPTGKFTVYVDFGFRYGHTNLVDTIYSVENGKPVNTKNVNHIDGDAITLTFPKITFELFSQRRIGFSASYSYNRTYAFTHNQYKQVMSYEKSDLNSTVLEKNARGSHIGELFARIETDRTGNGQLFLRSRFFWQQGDANTFFSQIQVGYNYNIIFRK